MMYDKGKGVWVLVLNKYQRDNLLWLLEAIGYGEEEPIEPFNFANTGDWVGEISLALGQFQEEPLQPGDGLGTVAQRRPNVSHKELRENVRRWLIDKSQAMQENDGK